MPFVRIAKLWRIDRGEKEFSRKGPFSASLGSMVLRSRFRFRGPDQYNHSGSLTRQLAQLRNLVCAYTVAGVRLLQIVRPPDACLPCSISRLHHYCRNSHESNIASTSYKFALAMDARVEDYLNDKLQTLADFDSLDALLTNLKAQQDLLKQQVHYHFTCSSIPRRSTDL